MSLIILILIGAAVYAFYKYFQDRERNRPVGDYRPRAKARFRNPANGYEEDATSSWLWCFLFGPFYFAWKGVWTHAVFSACLAIITFCISWLFYPFFAREIIQKSYLRKGWQLVEDVEAEPTPVPASSNSIDGGDLRAVSPQRISQNIQPKEIKRSVVILAALLGLLIFAPKFIINGLNDYVRNDAIADLNRDREDAIPQINAAMQKEDYVEALRITGKYIDSGDAEIIRLHNEAKAALEKRFK